MPHVHSWVGCLVMYIVDDVGACISGTTMILLVYSDLFYLATTSDRRLCVMSDSCVLDLPFILRVDQICRRELKTHTVPTVSCIQ